MFKQLGLLIALCISTVSGIAAQPSPTPSPTPPCPPAAVQPNNTAGAKAYLACQWRDESMIPELLNALHHYSEGVKAWESAGEELIHECKSLAESYFYPVVISGAQTTEKGKLQQGYGVLLQIAATANGINKQDSNGGSIFKAADDVIKAISGTPNGRIALADVNISFRLGAENALKNYAALEHLLRAADTENVLSHADDIKRRNDPRELMAFKLYMKEYAENMETLRAAFEKDYKTLASLVAARL